MRYIILGTSGHIDHGKTTLIKALTGRDTDNLEEEKRRGISINLGFTYFDLPSGNRVGIIDVPGHERFVKNMMSGTVGIDIVLMIVAADDGVMPQTLEHAEILTYMGIKDSIIVITKSDTVEEEMLDLVKLDIKESFKDTIFKDSPIVKVDSISKRGFNELIDLIDKKSILLENKEVNLNKPTRLNVDRSFSLKGHGTVITGTILEGKISIDEKYQIYPSKKEVKIRSIQVHGENVSEAVKGQRTAINLANIEKEEIQRGDILASVDSLVETSIIDTKIELSKSSEVLLKHWSRVRVFHGTKEVLARVVPLDKKEIKSGESGYLQIRLEEPIYCRIKDKFVIRNYSPVETIGGGVVLETLSEKHNVKDIEYLKSLEEKENYDLNKLIYEYINKVDFGTDIQDIYSYTGAIYNKVNKSLKELLNLRKIIKVNELYYSDKFINSLYAEIDKTLKDFHSKNPLESGISKEELRKKVSSRTNPKDFNGLLNLNKMKNSFKSDSGIVSQKDFFINLDSKDSEISKKILEKVKNAEPSLLKNTELSTTKAEKTTLSFLLKNELKLVGEFVIRKDFYEDIKENLISYLKENEEISLGEFRDLNGFSRKVSLAILENFDLNKITKRSGDKRNLY